MGVKTRATKTGGGKKTEKTETSKPTLKQLDASDDAPPQVFILPKHTSSDARITTLSNPATATPSRYLVCPERGFYEFTRIAAPKTQPRSWLLAPDRDVQEQGGGVQGAGPEKDGGYVLQTPDMMVATPFDPVFLLLPCLSGDRESVGQEYLAPSDFIAKLAETSPHLAQMLHPTHPGKLEQILEQRIASVCDCMDMGEEKLYALSLPRLVKELVTKAKRMTSTGLPASMEDRFVRQALEVPVLSIKREESNISVADTKPGAETDSTIEAESQQSITSISTTATAATAATSVIDIIIPEHQTDSQEISSLLRLRVALRFLMTSYISSSLGSTLEDLLRDVNVSGVDFTILDKRLEHVASMKKEAQALRSLSDNISRKRSAMEDDDEAMEKAEAKKRKKEEEETRKKNVSQGIKKLMKADTSGMKKLSSFFSKPPAKK